MTSEKTQAIHRYFNSILSIINIVLMLLMAYPAYLAYDTVYDEVSGAAERRVIESEIAQIIQDENSGLKLQPHYDSLGLLTVGFGHLVKDGENFDDFTYQDAITLLRKDYTIATKDVDSRYPWAHGEVRLVLINMSFQMGAPRLSKFVKTMEHLENKHYDLAAGEMLDSEWARVTPYRASRLVGRVMKLGE